MFSQLERRVAVQNYGRGTIAYEYGCISVLRLLWLRDHDKETWERVQLLREITSEDCNHEWLWAVSPHKGKTMSGEDYTRQQRIYAMMRSNSVGPTLLYVTPEKLSNSGALMSALGSLYKRNM